MTLEVIRVDVVTKVEAVRSGFSDGYPLIIEYDNRILVDTKTQKDPFLCVRTKLLSADQVNLSLTPTHRMWGQIELAAAIPEGAGQGQANRLLDYFYRALHKQAFGTIRTLVASPAPPKSHLGWQYYAMAVPFWSDQPT